MRDTVMNEEYFREYILEETGRIKNFQNKLENNEVREDRIYSVKRKIDAIQFELLIARYSSGEDIEKLENDFIQLLNDMPLYWNGNSSYIDMLWMMALAILFDVSREKFGILSDLVTQYNRKDALLEFFVNYKMHGSIEQLEGDYSFGFPYDKLTDIVANREKAVEKLKEIIYVFLTIFLYLLKCPQSLILSALRAFCFCGKPHISRSIFLYFRYQAWLKSW